MPRNNKLLLEFENTRGEIDKRFNKQDRLMELIVAVLLVGFATMLISVAGIILDTWRFNSSIYKEFVFQKEYTKTLEKTIEQQDEIVNNLRIINDKIKK